MSGFIKLGEKTVGTKDESERRGESSEDKGRGGEV